ncbi:peptidase inhibitor family I36 protein [Kitasatospora sp. NPDC059571]|uniref:peptidase inhibitor family I36 protein n=1 Tax=Kitasatospora sp. NPDC059571 TaxID=3346871 RepID=UPI00368036A3
MDRMLSNQALAANVTEDDVLSLLESEGVSTLRDLVARTLERKRSVLAEGDGQVRLPPLAFSSRRSEEEKSITHSAPHMALNVDGEDYEPTDITRFNGRPLHYLFDQAATDGPRLYAFTDETPLVALRGISYATRHLTDTERHLRPSLQNIDPRPPRPLDWGVPPTGGPPIWYDQGPQSGSNGGPKPTPNHHDTVQLFSDVNYQGDWFWMGAGYANYRLSRLPRNTVLFTSDDWNDVISSISGTNCLVTYWDDMNYGGSSFTPTNTGTGQVAIPDLGPAGWNDRISSLANYGLVI